MTGPVPGLFFVAHLYAHVVAFIFFTGIIAGHAWAEKARDPASHYTCPVVVGLRAFFFICATAVGLIFLDTTVKQLVLGVFGYGNVMHWLGMILLLATIGIEFIIAAAFVAPTRKALITFAAVVATFVYLMDVYFPAATDVGLEDAMLFVLGGCIVVGTVVQASLATAHGIYLKVAASRRVTSRRDTPLWDARRRFKRVFSFKVNVLLWVLLVVEFVLSFEGWGLLSWLSLDAFLGTLVGIAGGILAFVLISRWRANRKLLDDEWAGKHLARTALLERLTEPITMPDGTTLHGIVYGRADRETGPASKAPAVLFLHGFGGYAQDVHFEPMLSALAMAGYLVHAYDYRWSGHSRQPGQKGIFQGVVREGPALIEHLVADAGPALAWVRSRPGVDPDRIAVIGFSMGGAIALSPAFLSDPGVKVVLAGCAIHDIGEMMDRVLVHGPVLLRLVARVLGLAMKRRTGANGKEFLDRATKASPSTTVPPLIEQDPGIGSKVLLAHCKDDSVVDFERNFVRNQAMLRVPGGNCIVFESGDHEFLNDQTTLLAWAMRELARRL